MIKLIILFASIFTFNFLSAQTGIGTTTPNASAKLDVFANNKGFLPPRVSLTNIYDQTTVPSPATGLLVYCKGDAGLAAGYYFWNGYAWATIATAGGSGSFASSFLRGSRIAAQSIAVDGVVTFTNIDNTAGTDISLNTTTGKITLAAGNTYRLRGAVPNLSSGQRPAFIWYNETTAANIGSATFTYNPGDGAALPASGGMAEVIITPNVSTIVSLRLLSSLSSGSVTVGANADFSTTGSYPWFDVEVISGNAPVTGQSVDYVSTLLNANYTAVGNNYDIVFQQLNGGNIPYNNTTGIYTLTANKTYMMQAQLRANTASTTSAYLQYTWVDANTNTPLVSNSEALNASSTSGAGYGSKEVVQIIYTPSTNQTIKLRSTASSGTQSIVLGSANIMQIGSSAIVNPWVLSGNDVYNITGEVGIGTATPNTSAILDLTSTNKGFLPPRIALTAKSGNTTPIASPATGLVVYNSATAGTGGDAVTPGYYYYNGTIWTRMDPDGWSTGVPITFTAPSGYTAPTKGTSPTYDYVRYRNLGAKEYEVEYNFVQVNTGLAGNGDYLITLPGGLQFDYTATGQTAYTGAAGVGAIGARLVSAFGDLFHVSAQNSATAIPYDATRFRIHTNNWGSVGWTYYNYTYYQLSVSNSGFKMTFKFKAL